jgi:ATP-dependent DNA ligase
MSRLHPATSRVERLSRDLPARYVAFDLLAVGSVELCSTAFVERRARLEALVPADGTIASTPTTRDPEVARRWLDAPHDRPIDGVVVKPDDLRYEPGRRSMIKVKRQRTADCVVAGLRLLPDGSVSSLLLGLYDALARLHHVGVVTQLPRSERRSLLDAFRPLAVPLAEHPWRDGFIISASPLGRLKGSAARWTPDMEHDWLPVRPERVAEVGFDQVDGTRFRHPARLLRWRPDRDPRSCTLDQLDG